MKTFMARGLAFIFLSVLCGALIFHQAENKKRPLAELQKLGMPHARSSFSPHNRREAIERMEYELRRLRDPQTGRIPEKMRARELAFAQKIPNRGLVLKKGETPLFAETWSRRGPINVGGRTRALAIDLNYNGNSNRRILAGGASGGMFLSEDDGASWKLTTTLAQLASVTCLAQDPNNKNVWYYGTGENSGTVETVGGSPLWGQGIFKSLDGGNNWTQLASTIQNNKVTAPDNALDVVTNIAVHPQSSAIFAAAFPGILRSTDGGGSWQLILGRTQFPFSFTTDVAIATGGTIYAALSRTGGNFAEYGVYRSTTGGNQWSNITPNALATDPYRMVLGTAPSDPNTLYLIVQANRAGAVALDHQLFRYNAANNTWTDLSASIPNEQGAEGNASFSSQRGYDLIVKVKPDNPNVVWIGGTNLYRSANGGQTFTRVGGYLRPEDYAAFANHHADQHAIAFFPNNPNAMLSGNDGGLAKTTNVLAQPQTWTSLNTGYLTTQFFTVAVDPQAGSDLIIGGTQDNGCWLTEASAYETPWSSLPSGDGGYCAVAPGGLPFYFSSQSAQGFLRANIVNNQAVLSIVRPAGAQDFLFVAPYQLDPNDSRVMYLAAGNAIWRNSNLDQIPAGNQQPTSINWSVLSNSAVANMQVTTLAASKTPANRLYFGATDNQSKPVLIRVDNAPANPAGTNIAPPGAADGAYLSCVGVNPQNADEIIAVFSNYNVKSLWHSTNGGANWTEAEGNLGGEDGPSIRWTTIVPTNNGKIYFLATSTGIYSTTTLNGANTVWAPEGATPIGNVVVEMIVARPSDGVVVAGTHGRGVYSAKLAGVGGTASLNVNVTELNIALRPGTTRSVQFNLGNTGTAALDYNITTTGPTTNGVIHAPANVENDFSAPMPKFNFAAIAAASGPASPAGESSPPTGTLTPGNFADEALVLDDGNNTADGFIGLGANSANDFFWLNTFTPAGFGFRLEAFDFYMRTEAASMNPVSVAVVDANGNTLAQGNLTLATAPNGSFYNITVVPNLTFNDGQDFAIVIGASRVIPFPAGADVDAAVRNQSFYLNPNTNQYVNLNTISGFENGAFIIRARGTKTGLPNQPPIARATLSQTQARVNESISFDASTSSDPDGQITQYLWNFGDGATSNQRTTTHAYAQVGNFTYRLTVTDNGGATGQTSGQVSITATPTRLTVNPANGTVAPNGSQTITVNFDAQGLAEGNYQGQLSITSNGGNRNLPVRITVSNSVKVDEGRSELPRAFALEQNYPNPFRSEATSIAFGGGTVIGFQLPVSSEVTLAIYNMNGQLVRQVATGEFASGRHSLVWDARDERGRRVANGVYLYVLRAVPSTSSGQAFAAQRKLVLMK